MQARDRNLLNEKGTHNNFELAETRVIIVVFFIHVHLSAGKYCVIHEMHIMLSEHVAKLHIHEYELYPTGCLLIIEKSVGLFIENSQNEYRLFQRPTLLGGSMNVRRGMNGVLLVSVMLWMTACD